MDDNAALANEFELPFSDLTPTEREMLLRTQNSGLATDAAMLRIAASVGSLCKLTSPDRPHVFSRPFAQPTTAHKRGMIGETPVRKANTRRRTKPKPKVRRPRRSYLFFFFLSMVARCLLRARGSSAGCVQPVTNGGIASDYAFIHGMKPINSQLQLQKIIQRSNKLFSSHLTTEIETKSASIV